MLADAAPLKRRLKFRVRQKLFQLLNVYPPYLGAGVRLTRVADDLCTFDVEMQLKPWNKNLFGTHFGGSLYSMCDPFFVIILSEHLGRGYEVWDKAATIRFKKPGRGTVRARFHIDPLQIDAVRAQADLEDKVEPVFTVQILDTSGEVVAEIDKTVQVRRAASRVKRDRV
jgi:acyl-coenzyme A thioesterase PaaI-like protein